MLFPAAKMDLHSGPAGRQQRGWPGRRGMLKALSSGCCTSSPPGPHFPAPASASSGREGPFPRGRAGHAPESCEDRGLCGAAHGAQLPEVAPPACTIPVMRAWRAHLVVTPCTRACRACQSPGPATRGAPCLLVTGSGTPQTHLGQKAASPGRGLQAGQRLQADKRVPGAGQRKGARGACRGRRGQDQCSCPGRCSDASGGTRQPPGSGRGHERDSHGPRPSRSLCEWGDQPSGVHLLSPWHPHSWRGCVI